MELHVLGSNSSGNQYLLEGKDEALLLEAGLKFSNIKNKLGSSISKISGAIITHEHGDHSKFTQQVLNAGIDTYTSAGTIEKIGITSHRLKAVKANEIFTCGNFKIIPFNVAHDCAEPFGYFINHPETGNILFVTDSYYIPFVFKGLSNIMVEANYDKDILQDNYEKGNIHYLVLDRIYRSHMEIQTTIEFLKASDLTKVNNIVLLHLSNSNSNPTAFKSKIESLTAKQTHIAIKGLSISFNKQPF